MEREVFRRRDLPHWDIPGAAYFVTTCLHGSIPAEGRLDIEEHLARLRSRKRPEHFSEADWALNIWKLNFARTEQWLDMKPGSRYLKDPQLAQIVVEAMHHFADVRYQLISYVVMPCHLHWVYRPLEGWAAAIQHQRTPREQIIHSVNRYTAARCNELLGRDGQFWQHESYDHWVRDDNELEQIIAYIEDNPVKAGLVSKAEDYPYSSAYKRL